MYNNFLLNRKFNMLLTQSYIRILQFQEEFKLTATNKFGKEWSQLCVTKELRKVVNKIAIDNDKHVYDLAENVFKQMYPSYFQNQEIKN